LSDGRKTLAPRRYVASARVSLDSPAGNASTRRPRHAKICSIRSQYFLGFHQIGLASHQLPGRKGRRTSGPPTLCPSSSLNARRKAHTCFSKPGCPPQITGTMQLCDLAFFCAPGENQSWTWQLSSLCPSARKWARPWPI